MFPLTEDRLNTKRPLEQLNNKKQQHCDVSKDDKIVV